MALAHFDRRASTHGDHSLACSNGGSSHFGDYSGYEGIQCPLDFQEVSCATGEAIASMINTRKSSKELKKQQYRDLLKLRRQRLSEFRINEGRLGGTESGKSKQREKQDGRKRRAKQTEEIEAQLSMANNKTFIEDSYIKNLRKLEKVWWQIYSQDTDAKSDQLKQVEEMETAFNYWEKASSYMGAMNDLRKVKEVVGHDFVTALVNRQTRLGRLKQQCIEEKKKIRLQRKEQKTVSQRTPSSKMLFDIMHDTMSMMIAFDNASCENAEKVIDFMEDTCASKNVSGKFLCHFDEDYEHAVKQYKLDSKPSWLNAETK